MMKKIILMILVVVVLGGDAVKVNGQIIITTAGNGGTLYNGDSIPSTSASVSYPRSIAFDYSGNIYIADGGHRRIRKVDKLTGIITTIAGTGNYNYNGDNIPATTANIDPQSIAFYNGNLYVADGGNYRVRKIVLSTGIITTVAGTGGGGYNGDNIQATTATLYYPVSIAVSSGQLYIADFYNERIRRVDLFSGVIITVAGNGTAGYNGDNIAATSAELNGPSGISFSYNNMYIADAQNNRIRQVDGSGTITTAVGTGNYGYNGDNMDATTAELAYPVNVFFSGYNLYIADMDNNRVRKVDYDYTGYISTIVGQGPYFDNVIDSLSRVNNPVAISVDSDGNIYIADNGNHRVRKIMNTPCSISQQHSITANGPTSLCNGDTVILDAGTFAYFNWNTGQTTKTLHVTTTGNYVVTITNWSGCTATDSMVVMVSHTPVITVNGPTTFCNGSSVVLDAGMFRHYIWSSGETTESIVATTTGTYTITATDTIGCVGTNTASQTVIVNHCNQITCNILYPSRGGLMDSETGYYYYTFQNYPEFVAYHQAITLRSLIKFDYSSIPTNAFIDSSLLSLYWHHSTNVTGQAGYNASLLQRIDSYWNLSLSWGNQPTTTTVNQIILPTSTSTTQSYPRINVLPMVNDMITYGNYGFFLKLQHEDSTACMYFASQYNTDSTVLPRMKVCYQLILSLVTNAVSTNLCPGGTLVVPYSKYAYFNSGNVFTAQLSDANGSFTNPITIGSITDTASGTISAIIPSNSITGIHYRIRVIGNNPFVIGGDNGVDITIGNLNPSITPSGPTTFCIGGSVVLDAGTYSSYHWSNGATTQTILVTTGNNYVVTVTSTNGCTGTVSQVVTINNIITASITPNGPTTFCQGGSVLLDAGFFQLIFGVPEQLLNQ